LKGGRRHLEKALALFDPVRDRDLSLHFGQDPGLAAMAYLPLTLWPLGEVVRAGAIAEDLVERTSQTAHAASIAYGYMHAFSLALVRANSGEAAACADALAGAIRDRDMDLWRLYATFPIAWAKRRAGAASEALPEMRRSAASLRDRKISALSSVLFLELAQAEANDRHFADALATIDEATAMCDRTGERWYLAEFSRVRGDILLRQEAPDPARAEEALLEAMAIAQAQGARSFRLRATLRLAELYRSTGRPH
jgi:predicted ATPase